MPWWMGKCKKFQLIVIIINYWYFRRPASDSLRGKPVELFYTLQKREAPFGDVAEAARRIYI